MISTKVAHRKLDFLLKYKVLKPKINTVIDAPTALGKTHAVATAPWRDWDQVTGGKPVIQFHATTETRDEAAQKSESNGRSSLVLKSGLDICPTALGHHDRTIKRIDGEKASKWLHDLVKRGNHGFQKAHEKLSTLTNGLPCQNDGGCPSEERWDGLADEEIDKFDIIHATHHFAHVYGLVKDANVIFDEQPEYVRSPKKSEEELISDTIDELFGSRSKLGWKDLTNSAVREDVRRLSEYQEKLGEIKRGLPLSKGHHKDTLNIANACTEASEQTRGRRFVGSSNGFHVVIDAKGNLTQLFQAPDLSKARCVVGLDAYPTMHLWRLNTVEDLQSKKVLGDDERQHWRKDGRALRIVQADKFTNSFTQGWRSERSRIRAESIISELHQKYNSDLSTAVSSKAIKDNVKELMKSVGIQEPRVLYFGNLKSRDDFKYETIGLVIGCNDPGDEKILDWLALRGLDAIPEENEDGDRLAGRGFVGPDQDAAAEFLASVRENNLAQAVGRYARDPIQDGPGAIVYVMTNALPAPLVDRRLPGVTGYLTEKKEKIGDFVRENGVVTKKMVAEEKSLDTSPSYANQVLNELADQGICRISEGTGYNGAHEYEYISGTLQPPIDLDLPDDF